MTRGEKEGREAVRRKEEGVKGRERVRRERVRSEEREEREERG